MRKCQSPWAKVRGIGFTVALLQFNALNDQQRHCGDQDNTEFEQSNCQLVISPPFPCSRLSAAESGWGCKVTIDDVA
jgi:hypothetical protein